MHAAPRKPIKDDAVNALDLYAPLGRERQQFLHASAATLTDANRGYTPGAQGFQDGIDAVDDHSGLRLRNAAANSKARWRALRIRLIPDESNCAPRSMAGTAVSSSIPSASPVSARRMGWNRPLPFAPLRC